MITYKFQALDTGGKQTEGVLEAESSQEALRKVKEQGLFPVKIEPVSANGKESSSSSPPSEGASGVAKCHSYGWKIRLLLLAVSYIPFFLVFALISHLMSLGKPPWLITVIGIAGLIFCGLGGFLLELTMLNSFVCPRCHTSIHNWHTNDKRRVIYDCPQCGVKWDIGYRDRPTRYGG